MALHMHPAPRDLVILLLTRLAAHFWSDRGEAQWKIVIQDYAEDLGSFPADIIDDGIRAVRRKSKWWPKLAEILAEVEPLWQARQRQHARLEQIAGKIEDANSAPMDLVRRTAQSMAK